MLKEHDVRSAILCFASQMIYPVIPWFLCDLSFYLAGVGAVFGTLKQISQLMAIDMQDGKIG
jgi:hypothetical protein